MEFGIFLISWALLSTFLNDQKRVALMKRNIGPYQGLSIDILLTTHILKVWWVRREGREGGREAFQQQGEAIAWKSSKGSVGWCWSG